MMPKNLLIGNWGEQFVAMQLAANDCLIRHVTQGHDCGIDLYCEKVKGGLPYLSFACQIKTSKKFNKRISLIITDTKNILPHISFWLNQPIPVYIFFIPDKLKKDKVIYPYYFCSVLDISIVNKQAKANTKIINSQKDLEDFLENQLPLDVYKWALKNGNISFLKTLTKEYLKKIPKEFTNKYTKNIDQALLNTLLLRIYSLMGLNDPLIDELAKALENLVPLLDKEDHYHYYKGLGEYFEDVFDINKLDYDRLKAINNYSVAIKIIKQDSNTPNNSDLQEIIKDIESKISRLGNNTLNISKSKMDSFISASSAPALANDNP